MISELSTHALSDLNADRPPNLLSAGTRIKSPREGLWLAREDGIQSLRYWRKVHLVIKTTNADIRVADSVPGPVGIGRLRRKIICRPSQLRDLHWKFEIEAPTLRV